MMESLEERRLLFSLTIGQGDVGADGLGTVSAEFGYVIPVLQTTSEEQERQVTAVNEDFNDENVGNVASGFTFMDSNIQVRSNMQSNQMQVFAPDPMMADEQAFSVQIGASIGNFIELSFADGSPVTGFTFTDLNDIIEGAISNSLRVELFLDDQRLQGGMVDGNPFNGVFTGASLNLREGDDNQFTFQADGLDPDLPVFNRVVISSSNVFASRLVMDDVSMDQISTSAFGQIMESRTFGARVVFRGPVGATVELQDLYGNGLVNTLNVGSFGDSDLTAIDLDDNGIPDFNDGIGSILLSGTDSRTTLQLIGGTLMEEDGALVFEFSDSIEGLLDDFEMAGFGYERFVPPNGEPEYRGLPTAGGTLIVGSPFVRPLDDYRPAGIANSANVTPGGPTFVTHQVLSGFNNNQQGVLSLDGSDMGVVQINGLVHGSSRFTGAVDTIAYTTLLGSISVDGDLRTLVSGGDAAHWVSETDNELHPTAAQVVVGRTLGEVVIGGRSSLAVTVIGDINDPTNRPAGDVFNYVEREVIYGFDPGTQEGVQAVFNSTLNGRNFADQSVRSGIFLNDGLMRNDSLLGAEWVGSIASAVQVFGELGARDPVSGEDVADVYAFAADGRSDILIEVDAILFGTTVRVLDQNGRTVAAMDGQDNRLVFTPNNAGVYYLAVGAVADTNFVVGRNYSLVINGMAPVSFGSYRTVSANFDASIISFSGSMGAVRIGTGYVNPGGGLADGSGFYIPVTQTTANDLIGGSFSVPKDLFSVTTGFDVETSGGFGVPNFVIGRDLGVLVTGLTGGGSADQGDVLDLRMQVGRNVGLINVTGAIGVNQDADGEVKPTAGSGFVLTTGTKGGSGNIGFITVGDHVGGGRFTLNTPSNSTIGGFAVDQGRAFTSDVVTTGVRDGLDFFTGIGSDVRFVDFPNINLGTSPSSGVDIVVGQPVVLVDDGGGTVTIQIIGGIAGANLGKVRFLPINGSQGVAIATIEVDLSGGERLEITSDGEAGDIISIGRIQLTNATAASSVRINGNVQIDVWRIVQGGGDAFDRIENFTPGGDIIAIDVVGLTNLTITNGHLGRTQVVPFGPQLIGPFLGIASGLQGNVGGPIGVDPTNISNNWNGNLYRPVADGAYPFLNPTGGYLSDIGAPVNPFLNGLIVRTGGMVNTATTTGGVFVSGAIGDVILQDAAADIGQVVANSDGVTPNGEFHGIIGVIFSAGDINSVNLGDGLAPRIESPFSSTGIFAHDDIRTIFTTTPNANIESTIAASNNGSAAAVAGELGITLINLDTGGDFRNAFINTTNWLNAFWSSRVAGQGDNQFRAGTVSELTGENADFFNSDLNTNNLPRFVLQNGFFDASRLDIGGNLTFMSVTGFRNSTLIGSATEVAVSSIIVNENLITLETENRAGDIVDLNVQVIGSITDGVRAANITRSTFRVNNIIELIEISGSFRGSGITAGSILSLTTGVDLRASEITVSGPIVSIVAQNNIINTNISSTGPDGQIDLIRATFLITGTITSSGPVTLIETTVGDLAATIITNTSRGNIATLRAARDLNITTDIEGTVNELIAGRHIGNRADPSVILIRSNLNSATAGGQLYSDLRVGESILGQVSLGPVVNMPSFSEVGFGSIIAFGRINSVFAMGDFGGTILSYSSGIGAVEIFGGSLLPQGSITAFDGNIDSIVVRFGNLYGDIYADYILFSLSVIATPDGIFGDIGINPNLSSGVGYDGLRNQLPPGVAAGPGRDGPRIEAGWNIGNIFLDNGSIFETVIHAGRAIGFINVNGDVTNDFGTTTLANVIAAGDSIFSVSITGTLAFAWVLSGVEDFGADGLPGGTGVNADTVKSGWIQTLSVGGNVVSLVGAAGTNAGADGSYNSGDDLIEIGVSFIQDFFVSGNVQGASLFSDAFGAALNADARFFKAGFIDNPLPINDPDIAPFFAGVEIANGVPFAFTNGAETGTILYTGAGRAFWDAPTGRVILGGGDFSSSLIVESNTGTLTDFDVVSLDDSSMGLISLRATVLGDSDVVIDAFVFRIESGHFMGTGDIRIGQHADQLVVGNFLTTGSISAKNLAFITFGGDYGSTVFDQGNTTGLDILSSGQLTVGGNLRGRVNVIRDVTNLNVAGAVDNALVRVGNGMFSFTAASVRESRVSARNFMDFVSVAGDVFDSQFMVGADLGADANFGGTGLNADSVSTGFNQAFNVGGGFPRSDFVAGGLRGTDGFFGTDDDKLADGRSIVGPVTIGGASVGSNLDSESYRIGSTGALGPVTLAGNPALNQANFAVEGLNRDPLPIVVEEIEVTQDALVYTARIIFNQPMDESSLSGALTVQEVRAGNQLITLVEGVDYTVAYDASDNAALVEFSRDVTGRDLPQLPGVPGPGIYRFNLDQDTLRAQIQRAELDGNGDGFATNGDDYSADDIVGDAGDKLVSETVNVIDPVTGQVALNVDLYAPINLNTVLDNNFNSDGLPDTNETFTLRGTIGDHPDNRPVLFGFQNDVDVYTITLQAGQIVRAGNVGGAALNVQRTLIAPDGSFQTPFEVSDFTVPLPAGQGELAFLVKETGTYTFVVGNPALIDVPGQLPNDPSNLSGETGDYSFDFLIFDDGDSGFAASTDSGDGAAAVNAPPVFDFAGPDGVFGTPDDRTSLVRGTYTFFHNFGPDGVPGTGDDTVNGSNPAGATSTRVGDALTVTVPASIGPSNHAGVPGDVFADVDVLHLNNRQAIPANTNVRVTVKLSDLGADLGSRAQEAVSNLTDPDRDATGADTAGSVQFALFDVTDATDIEDGVLVFSPTEFTANGGTPNTVLSDNGTIRYGFDANGDFFVQFATPSVAREYAVYLQGVFNTDYVIEIVQQGVGQIIERKQNFVIETNGGEIDWLQVGGVPTELSRFDASALGFTGNVQGNQSATQFILTSLIDNLNDLFQGAGLNVEFSLDPNDFEFQDFSTIFLSNANDPIEEIFSTFSFIDFMGETQLSGNNTFGFSERSDPFNSDRNDEGVVFVPSFSLLGLSPGSEDLDALVQSITAGVGRRAGELMGLRVTDDNTMPGDETDVQAADSVAVRPTVDNYVLPDFDRPLSDPFDSIEDTNFFLGLQNAVVTLDYVLN